MLVATAWLYLRHLSAAMADMAMPGHGHDDDASLAGDLAGRLAGLALVAAGVVVTARGLPG